MRTQGFKKYLPRKLFSRTILIFLLPIVLIEVVVFVAFIQRHFEQVTSQMSELFTFQVNHLVKYTQANKKITDDFQTEIIELGQDFDLDLKISRKKPKPKRTHLQIFDFSGKAFVETMRKNFGSAIYFDFSERKKIILYIPIDESYLCITLPRSRISAANPHQLLVLMVFVSILLVLIALIVLRNQIKPIIKLAEVSDAFGKGQSLPFKPTGSEEVRRAGLAFLSMRTRLEKQIEHRTKMLSEVSHDLRTPLTRLKLSLTLLKNQSDAKEILKDVDSMEVMLDEFLTFAKSDSIEEFQKINLAELIKEIIIRNMENGRDIKFEFIENFHKFNNLQIRKNIFKRALQNLIDNAFNHGKKSIITLIHNKKFVTITVEDNGPGIEKNQRDEALKPFSRLDNSRNQNNHTGVGLGLSITLDTVRSHGGNLSLGKSEKLGGLIVKITLPI